jgi:hypothetical protein
MLGGWYGRSNCFCVLWAVFQTMLVALGIMQKNLLEAGVKGLMAKHILKVLMHTKQR